MGQGYVEGHFFTCKNMEYPVFTDHFSQFSHVSSQLSDDRGRLVCEGKKNLFAGLNAAGKLDGAVDEVSRINPFQKRIKKTFFFQGVPDRVEFSGGRQGEGYLQSSRISPPDFEPVDAVEKEN